MSLGVGGRLLSVYAAVSVEEARCRTLHRSQPSKPARRRSVGSLPRSGTCVPGRWSSATASAASPTAIVRPLGREVMARVGRSPIPWRAPPGPGSSLPAR